jgi:hypothetical protein
LGLATLHVLLARNDLELGSLALQAKINFDIGEIFEVLLPRFSYLVLTLLLQMFDADRHDPLSVLLEEHRKDVALNLLDDLLMQFLKKVRVVKAGLVLQVLLVLLLAFL